MRSRNASVSPGNFTKPARPLQAEHGVKHLFERQSSLDAIGGADTFSRHNACLFGALPAVSCRSAISRPMSNLRRRGPIAASRSRRIV
jgi:hypothetical protein